MHRELSPEAVKATLARNTPEAFLAVLQITGPGLTPIRAVNNTESITRNGQVFDPGSFDADPPEDSASKDPTVTLVVDAVDPEHTRQLRGYTGVPECEIVWIMASQPDRAVYGPFEFVIRDAKADELVITLELGHEENILNQGFPGQTYSPTNSPNLYV